MDELDPVIVAQKLAELNGNVAAAAQHFRVARATIKAMIIASVALRDQLDETKESQKDMAESALYRAVLRGESWAVKFYLQSQAPERGYGAKRSADLESLTNDELKLIIAEGTDEARGRDTA